MQKGVGNLLNVILGYKEGKPKIKDISKDKIVTICGITSSGKTTYMLELILQLIINNSPDEFKIIGKAPKNNLDFLNTLEKAEPHIEKIFFQDLALIEYLMEKVAVRKETMKKNDDPKFPWILMIIEDLDVSKLTQKCRDMLNGLLPKLSNYKIIPILTIQRPTGTYITDELFEETTTFILTKLSKSDLARFSIDENDIEDLYTLKKLVITDKSRYIEVKSPVEETDFKSLSLLHTHP